MGDEVGRRNGRDRKRHPIRGAFFVAQFLDDSQPLPHAGKRGTFNLDVRQALSTNFLYKFPQLGDRGDCPHAHFKIAICIILHMNCCRILCREEKNNHDCRPLNSPNGIIEVRIQYSNKRGEWALPRRVETKLFA